MLVKRQGKKARDATVTKAHATLVEYDILYKNGTLEKAVPVNLLRDKRVCNVALGCDALFEIVTSSDPSSPPCDAAVFFLCRSCRLQAFFLTIVRLFTHPLLFASSGEMRLHKCYGKWTHNCSIVYPSPILFASSGEMWLHRCYKVNGPPDIQNPCFSSSTRPSPVASQTLASPSPPALSYRCVPSHCSVDSSSCTTGCCGQSSCETGEELSSTGSRCHQTTSFLRSR